MSNPFTLIFWGLALIMFDLRLGRIDIFPDILGYLLIAMGGAGLSKFSLQFRAASILSWIAVPVSLSAIMLSQRGVSPVVLLGAALDCAIIWCLLGGVISFALSKQRADLAGRAMLQRIVFLVLTVIAIVLRFIASGSRDASVAVALTAAVAAFGMLPLLYFMLQLIHQSKLTLKLSQR